MRHKSDIRTILTLFIFACMQIWLIYFWSEFHWPIKCFFVLCNSWMILIVTMINHNHQHLPIFKNDYPNQMVNFVISTFILAPSSRLHAVHHFNHHKFYKVEEDWTHYKLVSENQKGLKRSLIYIFKASLKMAKNRKYLELPIKLKATMTRERLWVFFYSVCFVYLSPSAFFQLMIPAVILGFSTLLLFNLANHDGCKLDSEFEHSRNFLFKPGNWISFNNGYHTSHHLQPSLHWSLYPKFHEEHLESQLPSDLMVKESTFFYFLKRYFFSTDIYRK